MRHTFGAGISDWTFGTIDGVDAADATLTVDDMAQVVGAIVVTFWTAESAGSQYTDLLDINGLPVTYVTSSDGTDGRAKGQIPQFFGPDEVTLMWAQAGDGPRAIIKTTDDLVNPPVFLPPLSVPGAVTSPATGKGRLYNDSSSTWQVTAVRASVGTAPSAALIVDINRNGTTVFSTADNRPTIPAGENTSGKAMPLDLVLIAPGDYITADVDAGAGAEDLVVQILAVQANL